MQIAQAQTRYTPDEYLALEEQADFKSEYHDGEIIPMAGGSFNHNEIITNFSTLKSTLRKHNYRLFINDVRVWIPEHQRFTYPDVIVTKGEPSPYQNRTDTLLNPALIVEVLSRSTQEYDQGDKFKFYCSLPDFQEYLLINQYKIEVQQYYYKSRLGWLSRTYESSSDVNTLTSLELDISVADLYEGVTFDQEFSG